MVLETRLGLICTDMSSLYSLRLKQEDCCEFLAALSCRDQVPGLNNNKTGLGVCMRPWVHPQHHINHA